MTTLNTSLETKMEHFMLDRLYDSCFAKMSGILVTPSLILEQICIFLAQYEACFLPKMPKMKPNNQRPNVVSLPR